MADTVDLCNDNSVVVNAKAGKLEPGLVGRSVEQQNHFYKADFDKHKVNPGRQESEENRSSSALNTDRSSTSILDQEKSPVEEDTSLCSTSAICAAPLVRQFWKAGHYEQGLRPTSTLLSIMLT